MSVTAVETYVVRAEKADEFEPALQEFLRFRDAHPEVFAGVRSWSLYRQEYGAVAGLYVEMWEFDDLAGMEEANARVFAHETMKSISRGFRQLIDPATFSASVWRPVAAR